MMSIQDDLSICCVENGMERAGVDARRRGQGWTRQTLSMDTVNEIYLHDLSTKTLTWWGGGCDQVPMSTHHKPTSIGYCHVQFRRFIHFSEEELRILAGHL